MSGDVASELFLNPLQFYPIPNEKGLFDSSKSKPKIEGNIDRLKMLGSPSVEIDSATGSLGFITDDGSYLRFRDLCDHFLSFSCFSLIYHAISISLGHDEPPIKHAFMENKQRTNTFNVTAGLAGGKPTATGAYTHAKVDAGTIKAAQETLCSKIEEPGCISVLNTLFSLRHFGSSSLKPHNKVVIITAQ
jgi:hypothetical protein